MLFLLFSAALCRSSMITLILTVLFKDGKELSVINDLADAIIHGRSGTGKTVPAGPGVFEEIRESTKYRDNMMFPNFTAAKLIRDEIKQKMATHPAGTIESKIGFKQTICFQCDTLGNFCGKMNYRATYKPTDCGTHVTASAYYFGVDPWDFVPNPGSSNSDNFWREQLPGKLVSLRGNFKVYDITYNISETYEFDITN